MISGLVIVLSVGLVVYWLTKSITFKIQPEKYTYRDCVDCYGNKITVVVDHTDS